MVSANWSVATKRPLGSAFCRRRIGSFVLVKVQVKLEEMSLDTERSLVIYRLVQEALTNIAKYAQAQQVSVTLATEERPIAGRPQTVVEVRDNGRGFASAMRGQGHGLAGMRFRVSSIGGQLTVESAPGKGTCIRARLPKGD
jgi:signal transduction histidine kinase